MEVFLNPKVRVHMRGENGTFSATPTTIGTRHGGNFETLTIFPGLGPRKDESSSDHGKSTAKVSYLKNDIIYYKVYNVIYEAYLAVLF